MSRQNVTVSLPSEVLREARHLAIDEGVSLSTFLARLIAERVEKTGAYRAARERQRQLLTAGLNLGTNGEITWTREDLHER